MTKSDELTQAKRPRWIRLTDRPIEMLQCSECGKKIVYKTFIHAIEKGGLAFCPYCGHKLRKPMEM